MHCTLFALLFSFCFKHLFYPHFSATAQKGTEYSEFRKEDEKNLIHRQQQHQRKKPSKFICKQKYGFSTKIIMFICEKRTRWNQVKEMKCVIFDVLYAYNSDHYYFKGRTCDLCTVFRSLFAFFLLDVCSFVRLFLNGKVWIRCKQLIHKQLWFIMSVGCCDTVTFLCHSYA